MTLSSSTNIVQYAGTGAQVSFSVTFIFWDLDDLRVIHRAADGTETVWVRGTQYTLTGGDGATGTLTVVTSPTDYTPASGTTLTIKSNIGSTQPTDLPAGGAFPSSSVEEQMDKIVRMIQQRSAELDRSLKFAETDSTSLSATIPNSADRASKYLAFDADGEPTATAVAVGSAIVSAFMETVLDDTTAAAARTTLGAVGLTGDETVAGVKTFSGANIFSGINTFNAQSRWAKGADIASAATLVLGTDGNYFDVTGSTGPITAITVAAGTLFMLQFDSTPTLTHHATNLNLPGAANIVAAAGDRLIGFATAANTVHCVAYIKADGTAVAGSLVVATQAEMEAASSNAVFVSPGRAHFHPGMAKAWAAFNKAATVNASYNVTSVTDSGTGYWTITIATDFSSANYCALACGGVSTTGNNAYTMAGTASPAAGTFAVESREGATGSLVDPNVDFVMAAAFGDQA